MSEYIVIGVSAVVGSFFGQAAATLLFPATSSIEKSDHLAWMKCQEDINRLLLKRVGRLEAFARQSEGEK